jgi:hypothetical protein
VVIRRYAWLFLLGAGLLVAAIGIEMQQRLLGPVYIMFIAAADVCFCFAEPATEQILLRLRKTVRWQLLERGLLLLLLEPDPYARLPSLHRDAIPNARQHRAHDSGSFRERLECAVESYRGCCRDLGLQVPAWAGPLLPIAVRLELADLLRGKD